MKTKIPRGIKLKLYVMGIKTELPIEQDGLEIELNFRDTNQKIKSIVAALNQFRNMPEIDALVKSKEVIPLRDMLVWLLEEKFGLKVRVCGNCEHYVWDADDTQGHCFYRVPDGYEGEKVYFSYICMRDWAPKKVSEKKEN